MNIYLSIGQAHPFAASSLSVLDRAEPAVVVPFHCPLVSQDSTFYNVEEQSKLIKDSVGYQPIGG